MKISLHWLQRHVDLTGIEPKQILADLTMSTAEIEGLHRFGDGLETLVVGHVVARDKHADADKLSVCRVALGGGEVVQIVCGAPNVAPGQKVAVIRPGDTLPAVGAKGALKIKPSRIRGVESHGMICSESELGLSGEHDGILVLPAAAQPGARLIDVLPVQDWVFEIDNKSVNHRPDLWGHYGFARELAAIYGRELRALELPALPATGRTLPIQIEDREACPRYCGLFVGGVVVDQAPPALRYLLAAVGQRPINLPVDLTNFVMLDLGQPLHAFDAATLSPAGIVVRKARAGETITTLDEQQRKLIADDLLICDGARPVALAGVMGGQGTMVSTTTTALFVEAANFKASTVRRTSMRLGLRTESSARFEKAQDPANAATGALHFLALLQQFCPSARAEGPLLDPAGWQPPAARVTLRRERLDRKLGVVVPDERVAQIFGGLQFGLQRDGTDFVLEVPSFRATKDIRTEDDLIEEVGRMFRYDNIPEQPLRSIAVPPERNEELFLARRALQVAAGELRCSEAYNYSFVADAVLERCGVLHQSYARVRNPVAPELSRIRRHVLPSLLHSAQQNLRHAGELRLCEHGKGYHPERRDQHHLPHEVRELVFVWSRREGAACLPELREGVCRLLERLGYAAQLQRSWTGSDQPYLHPGRAVAVERDGQPVGFVGDLHPQVARAMELPAQTAVACVDLRALLLAGGKAPAYVPVPTYPSLPVDVALLVPVETQVGIAAEFLRRVGRKLIRSVELFEVYRGGTLPAGRKSLNFTVTLGAEDRTLTDEDEARFLGKVREQAAEIGAELRG